MDRMRISKCTDSPLGLGVCQVDLSALILVAFPEVPCDSNKNGSVHAADSNILHQRAAQSLGTLICPHA